MNQDRLTSVRGLRAMRHPQRGRVIRLAAQALDSALASSPSAISLSGPQRLQHGLILLLPGIGGESFMIQDLAAAF